MVSVTRKLALTTGLFLLFCGWCILLGGLSGLTDACYDIPNDPGHRVPQIQL